MAEMDESVFDINRVEINGIGDFERGSVNVVTGLYEGEEIASFSFDCVCNLDDEISSVILHMGNVCEKYRRQGVGTAIINAVRAVYSEIIVMNVDNNTVEDKNEIHYSDDGQSFIRSCINKGLVRSCEAKCVDEE